MLDNGKWKKGSHVKISVNGFVVGTMFLWRRAVGEGNPIE